MSEGQAGVSQLVEGGRLAMQMMGGCRPQNRWEM